MSFTESRSLSAIQILKQKTVDKEMKAAIKCLEDEHILNKRLEKLVPKIVKYIHRLKKENDDFWKFLENANKLMNQELFERKLKHSEAEKVIRNLSNKIETQQALKLLNDCRPKTMKRKRGHN